MDVVAVLVVVLVVTPVVIGPDAEVVTPEELVVEVVVDVGLVVVEELEAEE